jgi:DNA-binding CsgD family transcriptional regulator
MDAHSTPDHGPAPGPPGEAKTGPASVGGRRIRVAVVEEQTIFRFGLVACLEEDGALDVIVAEPEGLSEDQVDLAVISGEAARHHRFPCPIVVCDGPEGSQGVAPGNDVVGFLDRKSLTVAQLQATVHAAAAGLRVNAEVYTAPPPDALEPRALRVLALMAEGHSTREIATRMSYSERTIKKLITRLAKRMQARSRAQLVAEAMRRGLI